MLRDFSLAGYFLFVPELRPERFDLFSFSQLVQGLISGSVRRHTFSQSELELLLDLQMSRLRKSSRPDVLRRYLRALHQQFAQESTVLRLSTFLEQENHGRMPPPPPVAAPIPVTLAS